MGKDTKQSLLDAAEALFAEEGLEATSLRSITARAGVNLAAVNYHFGSKQGLIHAVLARRLVPMNEERLRRLRTVLAAAGGRPPPLEELVRAFAGPPLEMSRDQGKGGRRFVRLLGRTYSEPSEPVHAMLRAMYTDVVEAFRPAFASALPWLAAEELRWRMHFMVGLLAYLMAGSDITRLIASSRQAAGEDVEAVLERLVAFVAAGMRGERADPLAASAGGG